MIKETFSTHEKIDYFKIVMFGIAVCGAGLCAVAFVLAKLPEWLTLIIVFVGLFYGIREGLKWEAKQRREWDDLLNNRRKNDDE